MENNMDAELIPNEERPEAEEATEAPQPVQQVPPSYSSNVHQAVYSNGQTQPQGFYAPQPQQSIIIQNVPAVQTQGCCGGRSEWFKDSVGMGTGFLQLILAILSSILSGVAIYLQIRSDMYLSTMGSPIGATIFIFLPAGILGACSKNKSNCVIVAYLVMSILAAIQAAFVCIVESFGAAFSIYTFCPVAPDYHFEFEGGYDTPVRVDYSCGELRHKCLTAIHSVIAILMLAEFIVAIVASAICCNGLRCCCARPQTQQTDNNAMMYFPQAGAQPSQALMGTHVVQGTQLPVKA